LKHFTKLSPVQVAKEPHISIETQRKRLTAREQNETNQAPAPTGVSIFQADSSQLALLSLSQFFQGQGQRNARKIE